jgi:hypothetical protein
MARRAGRSPASPARVAIGSSRNTGARCLFDGEGLLDQLAPFGHLVGEFLV